MPKKKLSAISIPSLPGGRHRDHVIPGLEIVVGKHRRTWTYRYRIGGRNPRQKLGYFPAMGLQAARDAARKLIDRIESGAAPQPAPVHPRVGLTLGSLIDRYEALRQAEGHRIKTLPAAMATLRQQLKPYLSIPAAQFSKADLRAARDVLVEAGSLISANRLLGYLGPVMRWGAQEDLIPTNFVPDLRKSPERKRSRVLTDQELAAIWRACDRLGPGASAKAFGRLVRFLAATAQRKSEGASLKHGDILAGRWKQTTNKAERPHNLALPPLALQLVGRGEASALAFAGVGGRLGGYSKFKAALDKAAGVSGWRLHDLRRTAASRMQELGIRNEIIQAVLNHAVPGVGGVYLRAELEKDKAEALRAWATELERITGKRRAVS
jgi:integrase